MISIVHILLFSLNLFVLLYLQKEKCNYFYFETE